VDQGWNWLQRDALLSLMVILAKDAVIPLFARRAWCKVGMAKLDECSAYSVAAE
jgi:hypothetical protein